MGPEAEHIVMSFISGENEAITYDTTIAKIDDYFVPKRNVIFERARFHSRVQVDVTRCIHSQTNAQLGVRNVINVTNFASVSFTKRVRKVTEEVESLFLRSVTEKNRCSNTLVLTAPLQSPGGDLLTKGQFIAKTQLQRDKKTLDCHFRNTVSERQGKTIC